MRRSDARAALDAAQTWQQRGMFKAGAFEAIEKELTPAAQATSLASQALYLIGGILLGAATAALYALLDLNGVVSGDQEIAWLFFTFSGLILLLAGVALRFAGQAELGDAALVASLVPWCITLGPETYDELLRLLPLVVGVGLMVWRRHDRLLPFLGLAVALASVTVFLFRGLETDAFLPWFLFAAAAFAAVSVWMRLEDLPWRLESEVATAGLLAASMLAWMVDALDFDFDASLEVIFGLGLLALLAVGIPLQQRGTIGVAATALTIDAIVFAFDIGGPTTGLVVLVGLAAGLIVLATWLRRNRSNPAPDARA